MRRVNILYKEDLTQSFSLYINSSQVASRIKRKIALRLHINADAIILSYKLPNNSLCEIHDSEAVIPLLSDYLEVHISLRSINIVFLRVFIAKKCSVIKCYLFF